MSVRDFYKRTITVTRVHGIPVRIDYRWFVVFAVSVWLVASNLHRAPIRLPGMFLPPVDALTSWILGIITTAALFLSVLGHELSHALMARAEGIEIEEIVLHPFGGLARMRSQPESPQAEFRIAIAGPAASFIFAVVAFAGAKIASIAGYQSTVAVFFLVAAGNLLLAIFNLFPGYPLDGGRVLRALLWRRSGNIAEATRTAGLCGVVIAGILIAFGIYMAVAPGFHAYFMGLWSVLVGLFLLDAAFSVVRHGRSLRLATVSDAMSPPFALEPDLLVSHLIDEILPLHPQASFPVASNHRLQGILSLQDLKSLPRERWREKRARDVMRPIVSEMFVGPTVLLTSAREIMQTNGVGSLAVVDEKGELIGFLGNGKVRQTQKRRPRRSPNKKTVISNQ
jgi:Zn-dependent protease/CBS domain-containing protein